MLENSTEKLSLRVLHNVLKTFVLMKNRQHHETTELPVRYATIRTLKCILYMMLHKSSLPQNN